MVRAGARPNFREASCCRVEVVKGGCGWRLTGLASTETTEKRAVASAASNARASSPEPTSSRPIFLPSAPTRRAMNAASAGVFRWATIDQYSRATNFSISSSRSQTMRSATDCTRPAERAPGSLRHSTGDRLKPTR